MNHKNEIPNLIEEFQSENLSDYFKNIAEKFENKIVFSTSFGLEDQVITHLIFSNNIPIKVFTLDTGRLFPETYAVWNRTRDIYKKNIEVYTPQTNDLESLITKKGPFSFYESIDNRKECCVIRKVEPLTRALQGNDCWITGIRKEQSANRNSMNQFEWDAQYQLVKFHPLFNWSTQEIKEFISKNNIPYNTLFDKGYKSIGCQPCTRAVKSGEDERSGRWWWEDNFKKECGLHIS